MKKSGLADSPFFTQAHQTQPTPPSPEPPTVERKVRAISDQQSRLKPRTQPDDQVMTKPFNRETEQPSNRETMVSRYHDTIIEAIRIAVKRPGKEAATHRFTMEEKKALSDIIYAYKNQGIKTSEIEITRIAVNHILRDHKEGGRNSLLDKVLRLLHE